MKKFSKISGEKINDEPIKDSSSNIEYNEKLAIKASIYRLIDTYLRVQLNGSLNWPGSITIEGKDSFADAVTTLLTNSQIKDQVKLLESLKIYTKDWESIDKSIDYLNLYSENLKHDSHKDKIKQLFKNYSKDESILYKMAERQSSRIKDGETAFWRSIAAEQLVGKDNKMPTAQLKKIAQIFLFKSKQLGYKK